MTLSFAVRADRIRSVESAHLSPLLGTLCGDHIPLTWHPICVRGRRSQTGIGLDQTVEACRSIAVARHQCPRKDVTGMEKDCTVCPRKDVTGMEKDRTVCPRKDVTGMEKDCADCPRKDVTEMEKDCRVFTVFLYCHSRDIFCWADCTVNLSTTFLMSLIQIRPLRGVQFNVTTPPDAHLTPFILPSTPIHDTADIPLRRVRQHPPRGDRPSHHTRPSPSVGPC